VLTGVHTGDAGPTPYGATGGLASVMCGAWHHDDEICTREHHAKDPHIAGDGVRVLRVWTDAECLIP
jgi:hypothetical protein